MNNIFITDNQINQLRQGFNEAFITGGNETNLAYKPEFVFNNPKKGEKVLSFIERELQTCDSFDISVAFITSIV